MCKYSHVASYKDLRLTLRVVSKEGNGVDLIFHANTESGKTDDLQSDPDINLAFLASDGQWASISGKASIETDREKVRKYYSPALKAWIGDLGDGKHDGGPEDPRVCVIKVKAVTVQYAVSLRTAIGGFTEFAKGVVTGEAPQVNKLRHLEESELEQCELTTIGHLQTVTLTNGQGASSRVDSLPEHRYIMISNHSRGTSRFQKDMKIITCILLQQ